MLRTEINKITLNNCISNAAGCWCTNKEELDNLMTSKSGYIITKSATLKEREGNPEPRKHFENMTSTSINSMGVPNFGYKFYTNYINCVNDLSEENKKVYIHSIIPFNKENLIVMLMAIDDNRIKNKYKNIMIEVNLSCPNIINKSIVGYDYECFEDYLKIIQGLEIETTLGIKLPPYYQPHEFETISGIIKKYSCIKFITCINSVVNGLLVNTKDETTIIKPKNGFGGIGGIPCKPIALANVRRFYELIGDFVSIIGCGGIKTGEDAFQHILCGASAVQIGTQLMIEGPSCFSRIYDELCDIMVLKGYVNINDFKGKLKNL